MKERVDVEELRSRTDMEVAPIRRQIGLGLVGPKGVETLVNVVLFHNVPVPLRSVRVRCVDI